MKKVLLAARETIPSVELCALAPLKYLADRGEIALRCVTPLGCGVGSVLWADALVFVRAADVASLAAVQTARRTGKYCIYVLDDDLFDLPPGLVSAGYYARSEIRERMRAIMDSSQCFLTPSERLLEKYGRLFPAAGLIEEPALPADPAPRAGGGPVRIGFAGSVDRAGDVEAIVSGALRRVRARYGDYVNFEFFGARPALLEELPARHIPYEDSYERYRRKMETLGWDIALAPLPDTPFHRCKHYNKYIEYASFGIAGIYSDVEVYRCAVRHGENGLLAANTEDSWYEALCKLIEDEPLRRRLADCCLLEARTVYSVETVARIWRERLAAVPDAPVTGAALMERGRWAARTLLTFTRSLPARAYRAAAWFLSGEERM